MDQANALPPSPSMSRSSSTSSQKGRKSPPLSLDLSDLPPLIQPAQPSNTLLITNLQDPAIFHPASLENIRDLINTTAPIHSFSPLKSFRRIIVSFFTTDAAIEIRKQIDGETILGSRVRVYFGENTPINPTANHLKAPESQRLFFISPPPSPPQGWEMRNEDPPNKEVHAEDLAAALAKLHARPRDVRADFEDQTMSGTGEQGSGTAEWERRRQRSGSTTMIYHPDDHGDSPDLPAIAVEDTTASPGDISPMEDVVSSEKKIMAHTARPPVELMES